MMTSKYAKQINEIAEIVGRIDERTLGTNKRLDKLNSSQAKQWDIINANESMIGRLEERQGILTLIQGGFAVLVAGIAGWFGSQR